MLGSKIIHFCDSMWSFEWKRIWASFLSFVYRCIAVENPIIKRGIGIPLTDLTPPYLCPFPKPGFPTSYVKSFFMFNVMQ